MPARYDEFKPMQQSVTIAQAAGNAAASSYLTVPAGATRMRIRNFGGARSAGANALFTGTVNVGHSNDADAYYAFTYDAIDGTGVVAANHPGSFDAVGLDKDEPDVIITVPDGGNASDAFQYSVLIEWF